MTYALQRGQTNGYVDDRTAFNRGWSALGLPQMDGIGIESYRHVSPADRNLIALAGYRAIHGDRPDDQVIAGLVQMYEAAILPDLGSG